jgi:SRSO17 transposase
MGKLGKRAHGLVAVQASGVIAALPLPLVLEVLKPQQRRQKADQDNPKPHRAIARIAALPQPGVPWAVVRAERLSGERGECLAAWPRLARRCVVAMRAQQGGVRLPRQRLRATTWAQGARGFSPGDPAPREMRALMFGQRRARHDDPVTTAVEAFSPESTWVMRTTRPGTSQHTGGHTSGRRPGVA